MSAIRTAKVVFNGQDLVATYNEETQLWTATATAPADSSWSQPDHVYTASVYAEDAAGNSATVDSTDETYGDQLKIRVLEKTKPEGRIRTPADGSVLGANAQVVMIALQDNGGSGLNNASFVLKVNGTAVPLKEGDKAGYSITAGEGDDAGKTMVSYTARNLPDGANKVEFEFADNDGNKADKLVSNFTISTAAPTLDVTSPANNLLTNSNKLTVAGTAATTTAGVTVASLTIKVGDADPITATVGEGGAFSQEVTLPAEGDTNIVITATDSLGKNTQVTRKVTLDTTKPVITDITASATTVDAGGQIVFTFKVTDADPNAAPSA